jgi:hypothetical protein
VVQQQTGMRQIGGFGLTVAVAMVVVMMAVATAVVAGILLPRLSLQCIPPTSPPRPPRLLRPPLLPLLLL